MILKTKNDKMGKINNKLKKIRFHIWPIYIFRLHIYYIGIEDYHSRDENFERGNNFLKKNQISDLAL
jgi:hypothetical protein